MDLLSLLKTRRSIRKYDTNKEIAEDDLKKILQAALLSPTSRGIKSWNFIVIRDKNKLKFLSESKNGTAKFLENAGCAILVLGDKDKTDTWIEDSSIALSHMHLMAHSLGLGSCWIQIRGRSKNESESSEEYIKKEIFFPENLSLLAILAIGHPKRNLKANNIEELWSTKIHWEKF